MTNDGPPPRGRRTALIHSHRRRALILAAAATVTLAAVATACEPAPPATLEVSTTPGLVPAFTPGISDYVVSCTAGVPVEISVGVPPGGQARVDGASPQTGRFTTSAALAEGQAFTVDYQAPEGGSSRYSVRCAPADMPLPVSTGAAATAEFFVTNPFQLGVFPAGARPVIYDAHGVPVWWGPWQPAYYTTLEADGTLATGMNGGVEKRSLDWSLVDTIDSAVGVMDGHDWVELPNGHVVMVANQDLDGVDLTAIGGPASGTVLNHIVQEIDPADPTNPVWTWDVAEHIPVTEMADEFRPNTTYDVYHWNSIEAMGDGTYLLSFRHLDALYKIDPQHDIVWKLSGQGAPATGTALTIIGDPMLSTADPHLGGQHDARLLPGGTATKYRITVHDNRTGLAGGPRAVMYEIDEDAGTATFVMAATDAGVGFSLCCGSARWAGPPGQWVEDPGDWVIAFGGTGTGGEYVGGNRRLTIQQPPAWLYYRLIPVAPGVLDIQDLRDAMDTVWATDSLSTLEGPAYGPMTAGP